MSSHENEIELPLQLVRVVRDLDTISTEVFAHEVPILKAVHGPESVSVIDPEYGPGYLQNDASVEIARLERKYDRKNASVIARVFPLGVRDVAQAAGMELGGVSGDVAEQSSVIVRKPAPRPKASGKGDK